LGSLPGVKQGTKALSLGWAEERRRLARSRRRERRNFIGSS
jgi:hypothetical protein